MGLKIIEFCNVMWLRARSTVGAGRDSSLGKSTFGSSSGKGFGSLNLYCIGSQTSITQNSGDPTSLFDRELRTDKHSHAS